MAAEEGQVIRCHTDEEWTVQLNKAKGSNKMIVIGFCDFDYEYRYEIAPFIAELAKKFKSKAIFLEVDCFELKSVAEKFDVKKKYPTFVLMKGDKIQEKLHSSDKNTIEETIGKHVATSTAIPPPPEHQGQVIPEAKYTVATKEEMTNYLKKLEDEFTVQLKEAQVSKKLIVICFTYSDCPRCYEKIAPFIADLANKFKSRVIFLEIDGFKLEAVAKEFNVKTHPTFVLMKGKDIVNTVRSASKIEWAIGQQLGEPPCPEDDDDEDSEHGFPFSEEEDDGVEGQVIRCHTYDEWTVQLNIAENSNKLIVIYFTAPNCPRCEEIAPFIASLAKTYKSKEIFLEIDGFELQRVAKKFDVKGYPTIALRDCGLSQTYDLRRMEKEQIEEVIEDAISNWFNPDT